MNQASSSFESPCIVLLRETLKNSHQEALEKFWQEVGKKGTPLIEADEEDGHNLLTFVWREREETVQRRRHRRPDMRV